jgi:hypothetical protein
MTIQTNANAYAHTFCSRLKSTLKLKLQKECASQRTRQYKDRCKLDTRQLRKYIRAADNRVDGPVNRT